MMRTTLNLPEDVYQIAHSVASAKRISLGEAVAELVRRAIQPAAARLTEEESGLPRFTVGRNAAPITLAHTLDLEDEP